MMQDMELSIERLGDLKRLGIRLAVDDFGTGYSSLNYIRRFPVDILKVDKSFIDGVNDGGEASALTEAVIKLAGILNLRPVAEGIERADQLTAPGAPLRLRSKGSTSPDPWRRGASGSWMTGPTCGARPTSGRRQRPQ
jgi:sensor c-di-GMP phosphodiesterase-like protein